MQASSLYEDNEELIEHLIQQGQEDKAQLSVAGTYATSRFTQLVALAKKFRLAYWRSPSYNLTRMLMTLLICLFYGTVFWGRGRMPAQGERSATASGRHVTMLRQATGLLLGDVGLWGSGFCLLGPRPGAPEALSTQIHPLRACAQLAMQFGHRQSHHPFELLGAPQCKTPVVRQCSEKLGQGLLVA